MTGEIAVKRNTEQKERRMRLLVRRRVHKGGCTSDVCNGIAWVDVEVQC